MQPINLTGQVFGKWTVLERSGSRYNKATWLCQCSCANKTRRIITGTVLLNNKSQHCGCNRRSSRVIDLTGKQFGRWRVIARNGSIRQQAAWLVECSCPAKIRKTLAAALLTTGKSRSCGCLRIGRCNKDRKNLNGKQFNRLKVINQNGNNCQCQCHCGTFLTVRIADLLSGNTKSCGCLNRINLIGSKFGELTILYRDNLDGHFWHCRCQCGTLTKVNSTNLKNGNVKSCGCLKFKDLTNRKFGAWTVLCRYYLNDSWSYWRCKCDCGTIKIIPTGTLLFGNSISCGCLKPRISRWEIEVKSYIRFLCGPETKILHNPRINSLQPDIVIPDKKLIIECNGVYWHSAIVGSASDNKWHHYNRRQKFEELGYRVIFLWEDDWHNRTEAIKLYLQNVLRPDLTLIYDARKLTIVEIPTSIADSFMNKYHPQGRAFGKIIWLGLRKDLDLIACMGFSFGSRPIINRKHMVELIRYASKGRVRGGASRLLKYFINNCSNTDSIISFSDNDYFDGNMYQAIGFEYDGEVAPDYTTVWNNKRQHKSFTKRTNLVKLDKQWRIEFDPETMTEASCLQTNNIRRAWNSGKKRWLYIVNVNQHNLAA